MHLHTHTQRHVLLLNNVDNNDVRGTDGSIFEVAIVAQTGAVAEMVGRERLSFSRYRLFCEKPRQM